MEGSHEDSYDPFEWEQHRIMFHPRNLNDPLWRDLKKVSPASHQTHKALLKQFFLQTRLEKTALGCGPKNDNARLRRNGETTGTRTMLPMSMWLNLESTPYADRSLSATMCPFSFCPVSVFFWVRKPVRVASSNLRMGDFDPPMTIVERPGKRVQFA